MTEGRLVIEGIGNWAYTVWLSGQEKYVMGRNSDADIELKDFSCSKHHAQLLREDGQYFIEDLGSSNGTLLNGNPLRKRQLLRDGDEIIVGKTSISFLDNSPSRSIRESGDATAMAKLNEIPDPSATQVLESVQEMGNSLSDLSQSLQSNSGNSSADIQRFQEELDELRTRVNALTQQNKILRLLSTEEDFGERLNTALSKVAEEIGAENGFIMFLDNVNRKCVVKSRYGAIADWEKGEEKRPMSVTIVRDTLQKGKTIRSSMMDANSEYGAVESVMALEIKTFICVPIELSDGEQKGVVYFDRRKSPQTFQDQDEQAAQNLAIALSTV